MRGRKKKKKKKENSVVMQAFDSMTIRKSCYQFPDEHIKKQTRLMYTS
jgi:hypothetical protein